LYQCTQRATCHSTSRPSAQEGPWIASVLNRPMVDSQSALSRASTSLIELALVGLVIRYGHAELAPHLPRQLFALGVVIAVAGMAVLWLLVKRSIDDELYLISFPITAFWAVPFGTALMLRRRSRRGQTVLQPLCVAIIVSGFQGALWFVDDFFRSPEFLAFTAMAVLWSLGNVWLLRTLPAHHPEPTVS